MINLTRIDGGPITVNADEIETVESSHDSTLTLRSGRKIIVRETSGEIIQKVVEFRRSYMAKLPDVM
jgi:flagellar protein FlbD